MLLQFRTHPSWNVSAPILQRTRVFACTPVKQQKPEWNEPITAEEHTGGLQGLQGAGFFSDETIFTFAPSVKAKQTNINDQTSASVQPPPRPIHSSLPSCPIPFRRFLSYAYIRTHTHTHTNSHRAVLLVLPPVHTLAGSWPLRKKGDEMVFPLCSPGASSRPANITENKGYTHKHTHTY